MRRTALIILGVAGGLVALLLIGVAIAIATVDPNRFVAPLAARIKASTGRNLTVKGPVGIKLSLEPSVMLPDVAFDNATWSKTPQMLTAKRIEAQIALLPLLSRRFEVVQITLVDPVITLETDASGRGNWEFGAANASAPGASAASGGSAPAIGVANFEIRNGTLSYRNGATGKLTTASIDRMTLHARDMQAPVAVDFRGKVDDVPVALSGDVGAPDQWLAQRWPIPIALKGDIDGNAVKLGTKLARKGTTTSLDNLDVAYGALAGSGSIRVINDSARTRYAIELSVPTLAVADLGGQSALPPGKAAAPAPAPAAHWIIPDTPLPLAPLVAVDSEGSITIAKLTLRSGQLLQGVGTQFTSRDGRLDARFTTDRILGGSMHGELQFDGRNAEAPGVHLSLDAQELDLPALAAVAGIRRDIRGGKVHANVDIRGRGATPHRVASTMSGTILVVSGPASLGRSAVQGESALAQLAGALDPMQTVDPTTDLRCAVFRLPLADGIAHVDRSIAIETGKVAGSASGTLNFRDETLDLSVQPQLRAGVKIDVSQFASLVRIRGRFDKPSVGIDAAQSGEMLAKIGALAATGGTAAVIGGALLGTTGSSSAPCTVAMTGKVPREAAPARKGQQATNPAIPGDVGKALGRLFGR
jgi:AsmA family protein